MNQEVTILNGDSSELLKTIESESVHLIWSDPPFNTGDVQKHLSGNRYSDSHQDYYTMMRKVLTECHRVLHSTGTCVILLDYREVHYIKVMMDEIFGRENFCGEIVWLSELGAVSKKSWSQKHNTMLVFRKSDQQLFDYDKVPVESRKAPKGSYVAPKKVTSVWSYTMSNTAPERVAYPNQKPLAIIDPFIQVHTLPGQICLDPFAGSGSVGEAAIRAGRKAILIDQNIVATRTQTERMKNVEISAKLP